MQLHQQACQLHGPARQLRGVATPSCKPSRALVARRAMQDDSQPVVGADGTWYFMHQATSPVYGAGFVMSGGMQQSPYRSRSRSGAQLVVRARTASQVVQFERPASALAAVEAPGALQIVQISEVLDASSTAITVVPDSSSMLGVVLSAALSPSSSSAPLPESAQPVYETHNTCSPRRTHKIKFTCLRCGAINIKPVNPHAWNNGSVFAKCGKCDITHKLTDNLKLFHELSGPVFGPPDAQLYADLDLPPRFKLKLDWDMPLDDA